MKTVLAFLIMVLGLFALTTTALDQGNKFKFKKFCSLLMKETRLSVLQREAVINDIDSDLMLAIIFVESRGNSEAVSSANAKGIAQIMKANAKYYGFEHKEMFEDDKNLQVAYRLLYEAREFHKKNKLKENQLQFMLREYTAGRSNVLKNHLAGLSYAKLVKHVYAAIKERKDYVIIEGKKHKIDYNKLKGLQA